MQFKVLGPIEVYGETEGVQRLAMVGTAQRRLTALLVLRAGTSVSADYLVEHLGVSTGALRTSVSRLRRVLGFDVLRTVSPGYQLNSDDIDAVRFEAMVGDARSESDPSAAAMLLRDAIDLWAGPAFEEFADESWAIAEATRLTELRVGATEDLVELLLKAGSYQRASEMLAPLIAEEPYRDRPRGQLMRALAASGRRTDALRAFRNYRTFLLDEVGVEPSAAVVALDRQIALGELAETRTDRTAAPVGAVGGQSSATARESERGSRVVTFLLTEIESSIRMWDEHPKEAKAAVDKHHTIVSTAITAHSGTAFVSGGDGMAVAFGRPEQALAAAVEAQQRLAAESWPGLIHVRVRMGVHTGLAYERDGDFFGPTLNTVGRLLAAARGQQLLLSGTTVEALDVDSLPRAVKLRDRGLHQLDDIAESIEIFEVLIGGIPGIDLPLGSRTVTLHNLPSLRTTMIGRERELDHVDELLHAHRAVTIAGPGGCGKSALAVRVGHRSIGYFVDGVFHVELSAVNTAGELAAAVGRELRLEIADLSSTSALAGECRGRRMLLVLDNGEHLLDEVADLVDALLDSPGPSVLTTSRADIEVAGEQVVMLGPLDHVGPSGVSDGAQLFAERASSRGVELDLSPGGLADIEALCDRLDHLPFAIELAAAAARGSSPHQLGLDIDRGRIPGVGRRSNRRWTSLEEMVEWSNRLLGPSAQSLLRGLSPLRGGGSLEAIAAIWSPRASAERVAGLLDDLIHLNLVVVEQTEFGARYRLLETVRHFAVARATEVAEWDDLRRRHRDWYLRWSESFPIADRYVSSQHAWMLDEQIGNFRAALSYSDERQDLAELRRQTLALTALWWMMSRSTEGLEWLARANVATGSDDRVRYQTARFATALGGRAWDVLLDARPDLEDRTNEAGPEIGPLALGLFGVTMLNDAARALETIELAQSNAARSTPIVQQTLRQFRGEHLLVAGRHAEAIEEYERGFEFEALDSSWACAAFVNCAVAQYLVGDVQGGMRRAQSAHAAKPKEFNSLLSWSGPVVALAMGHALLGDCPSAATLLIEHSQDRIRQTRNLERLTQPIVGAAFVLAKAGDLPNATMLMAFIDVHGPGNSPWTHAITREVERLLGSQPAAAERAVVSAPLSDPQRRLHVMRGNDLAVTALSALLDGSAVQDVDHATQR